MYDTSLHGSEKEATNSGMTEQCYKGMHAMQDPCLHGWELLIQVTYTGHRESIGMPCGSQINPIRYSPQIPQQIIAFLDNK